MIKVIITDEMLMKYKYEIDNNKPKEVCELVNNWIMNIGETPIYEINILIED